MSNSSHLRENPFSTVANSLYLHRLYWRGVRCFEMCPRKKTSKHRGITEASSRALHGAVEVSFKIGLDGKANILDIKSANPKPSRVCQKQIE